MTHCTKIWFFFLSKSLETLHQVLKLFIYLLFMQLMYHIYVHDMWNFANKMWTITTVIHDFVFKY